jgi:hypothetical protein
MRTMPVYIPLQGPTGVRPKAPAVGAWQSPGYAGIDPSTIYEHSRIWTGMRCDGLVVIDCDSKAAALRWCLIDQDANDGWVRKTPRGFHYIYEQGPESPDAPSAGVFEEIDVRAGRTSQIVMFAPGYYELHAEKYMRTFNAAWLPSTAYGNADRSEDESWDEMPWGRGNNTMTAIAGALRKQGMSPITMAKCLGAINRITMTDQPMAREEIAQIVMSVARYAAKPDIDIEVED